MPGTRSSSKNNSTANLGFDSVYFRFASIVLANGPGFRKSATNEIVKHGYVLTPGRYVGAEELEDDGHPFEEKVPRLVAELHAPFAESARLEKLIRTNLKGLGYGG